MRKRNLALATSLVALLATTGCGGKSPNEPETQIETERFGARYDVVDTPYTEEVSNRLRQITHFKGPFPTLSIVPDTLTHAGQIHLLGFNVSGEIEYEVSDGRRETITPIYDLQIYLDWVASNGDVVGREPRYLRLGEFGGSVLNMYSYLVDGPNVPETEDLTARVDSFNNERTDIRLNPLLLYVRKGRYTRDDRSIFEGGSHTTYNEKGQRVVDGIEIIPIVIPGAGRTGDTFEALYVMTGDKRWLKILVDMYPKIEFTEKDSVLFEGEIQILGKPPEVPKYFEITSADSTSLPDN